MTPVALHAANPGPITGDGNWTYLIGREHPVLIDAGVGNPAHLDAIRVAAPAGLSHVVVTHAHSDHIAGAESIARQWPAAAFSKHPWPERDPKLPWRPLQEGSIVATDEGDLTVLLTPGHSPDHLSLWHAESRTLFVGDMLVLGSTVVILASHGGSLAAYLRSLERMRQLNPARALPAHGPAIEDPVALIDKYVAHRAQREDQVLSALSNRHSAVDAITATIYPALAQALIPMARESVLAHLLKLEEEGQVVRDADHWVLINSRP